MTNSDIAIREFAEKWGPTFTTEKGQYSDDKLIELCLSDLTALISEHYYPKEFMVWLGFMSSSINYREIDDKWLWVSVDVHTMNDVWTEYTLDELFNYWEENER